MQAVADYIVYYVSGVIDLFDDGVVSLVIFFVLAAAVVGIIALGKGVDFILNNFSKPGISGFRRSAWLLTIIALIMVLHYSADIMFWIIE